MLNEVKLIGRLGADPELRYTQSGTAVCKFRMVTNEKYTDREGNKQERAEWHSITAWRKLAEICGQYLTKGKLVYIGGTLRNDTWESDGVKRYGYHIEARDMKMLSGGNGQRNEAEEEEPPPHSGQVNEDDIPF